ncbi:MAG: ATP-dependent Clp protease ATP-binding subunit, partial [Anaerolineae bacterium]|nr:ATP-dependent Clp protease ATP-binding subunit [Anaerolineae bacterium]
MDQKRPVVKQLAGRRVIELSANAIASGTKYRGQLEERLEQLKAEVMAAEGEMIVFIDEIHNILGGGSNDAIAEALKPALARGEFPCIGATTVAEYRQYIEKDAALARRFTPIWLAEPTVDEAIAIVQTVATQHLAAHHQVSFEPAAIEAAVRLSARYLADEQLPGKAIKVLDEAASGLIVPGTLFEGDDTGPLRGAGGGVTVADVVAIIAERTNIPVSQLGQTDKQKLLALEERLRERIIGQDHAVSQVVRVIKRAGAGLADPRRPQGVFLFAGPTGVGKTELALALTQALFDNEEAIFRLDMSEFMDKHQVARLTGAPPGYVGYDDEGRLTGRLRRYPYSVILLDEIEKAHPEVQHLFLQLFDSGRLTDSQGRLADGRNAIFIMTTNLGAKEALGLAAATQNYQDKLQAAINDHFTMEFINRIDRIVYFNPLAEAALLAIFERELQPFRAKLEREHGLEIEISEADKQQLVAQIAQQKQGARPLRRFIEDRIIAPLVDKLLAGEL